MLKVPAKNTPPKPQLEILYRKQVRKAQQFAKSLEMYEYDVMFKDRERSYDELVAMVRKHLQAQRTKKNSTRKDPKPRPKEEGEP